MYRKKPVVIEAQCFVEHNGPAIGDWISAQLADLNARLRDNPVNRRANEGAFHPQIRSFQICPG